MYLQNTYTIKDCRPDNVNNSQISIISTQLSQLKEIIGKRFKQKFHPGIDADGK